MIGLVTRDAIDRQNAEILKAAEREVKSGRENGRGIASGRPELKLFGAHRSDDDDPDRDGQDADTDDGDEAAAKAYRAYLRDGHAAESPSNEPGRPRASGEGEIAAARHLSGGPHGVTGLDAQPPRVRLPWQAGVAGDGPMAAEARNRRVGVQGAGQEATVVTQTGAGAPAGSSYHEHGAAADRVEHMPAAAAASPSLAGHLGARAPSGVPIQPPVHPAPTGVNARFRQDAPQSADLAVALYGAGGRY